MTLNCVALEYVKPGVNVCWTWNTWATFLWYTTGKFKYVDTQSIYIYIYIHEFIGVRSNFIDNGGQSYSWQKSSFNLDVFVPYQSVAIVI